MDVRRTVLSLAILFLLIGCQNKPEPTALIKNNDDKILRKPDCVSEAIADQYIVRWKSGEFSTIHGSDLAILAASSTDMSAVDFIEPDGLIHTYDVQSSETSRVPGTWGLERVQAKAANALGATGLGIKVAVIDSGVDIKHPQLAPRLAKNSGEDGLDSNGIYKGTNGIDDDGNGLIDDLTGYDFEADTSKVTARAPHGTHVSGIILADPSENDEVVGVAPKASLIPIGFMNKDGAGSLSLAIKAIQYAVQQNAKIINASWGAAFCSKSLQKAIDDAGAAGVLFVAAAGNSGQDIGLNPEYPAAFLSNTQLTVGASNYRDVTTQFSNYSYSLVQLMAPGEGILSTYPGNSTKLESGTSMATPFVAGAAAAILSLRKNATLTDVRNAILDGVDSGPYAVITQGRLNILKSAQLLMSRVQP